VTVAVAVMVIAPATVPAPVAVLPAAWVAFAVTVPEPVTVAVPLVVPPAAETIGGLRWADREAAAEARHGLPPLARRSDHSSQTMYASALIAAANVTRTRRNLLIGISGSRPSGNCFTYSPVGGDLLVVQHPGRGGRALDGGGVAGRRGAQRDLDAERSARCAASPRPRRAR
jgi:hypothetical protein